jgi:tol-pal system protein YbgF
MSKNRPKYRGILFLLLAIFLASPLYAQTNPIDHTPVVAEEQDYAFALGLYHDGVYQLAEEQFGKFLNHYPESIRRVDALFLQNECRYYQGKFDSAIQGFTEFVRLYPKSKLVPDAQFRLGDSYLKSNKPIEAIAAYKIVLDQFGNNDLAGEAAYWIGESHLRLADYDNAIKYYSLAYENYPKNRLRDYALYSIGWTYQKKSDFTKATDWYGRFLKEFPESSLAPSAKVRIGECYYYSKDYKKAIEVLSQSRKTIAQDDERGQADYLVAEAYYQLGDYANAQKGYEAFLKQYKNHKLEREVIYALGWAYLKQTKFPEASQTFALDTTMTDGLASASLYRRSVAQKLAGDSAAAIATLNDLLTRDPNGDYADNALFDLGVMAFANKNIDDAKKDFTRVATGFPKSDVLPDSYMMVGECLLTELNYKEAHDWFQRAASNPSASFDVKLNSSYQTAWCLYKMHMLKEAAQAFSDFIKAYPQHPKAVSAQFWIAESEYALGNFDNALEGYKRTLASGNTEKRAEAMYGVGWSYFKEGNYQKAIEGFEQLVASYPNGSMSFDARLRIGDAYFELKDYVRAEGSYRVVIRLFPNQSGVDYANYQLGQALFRQEDYSEAYKQFEALIKAYPNSNLADDAQYALGWINFQRKVFPDAIREFQKLISVYPQSDLVPRALYSTGDSYYNLKQYSEAIKAYRELISRYPKSSYVADALNGEQYCLAAQGKQREAGQVMDSYITSNPGSRIGEDLLLKKGDMLFGQGDYVGAEDQYRELVKKYPKSNNVATALYWVAKCLRGQNKLNDAATTLESAIRAENASPGIVAHSLEEAAEIYTLQKQYDKAFSALTRIVKEFKDSEVYPDALYQMGRLYFENGNLNDAKDAFESVISQFPSSTAAVKGNIGLVRIDIAKGNFSAAENRTKEIATTRTDEFGAEAQYLSGLAFSGAKEWKNAITALLRVKYVFPSYDHWVAKSYVALGDAYVATKDSRRAKTAYQNALKFKQETETVTEAQKGLEKLQ